VDMDNAGGAAAALRHLLGSGRRRVTVMVGPPSMPCAAERLAACETVLGEYGLPGRVIRSAPQRGPAAEAFAASLPFGRPDAVLATHEEQGHAVLEVCARRGWTVPDDVAVVSFDDYPAPAGSRGYTSLSSVTPQLGAAAVRMVTAGAQPGRHARLPVRLLA
jgi:DNA-binding LacI/PurR family transcriptional regulator